APRAGTRHLHPRRDLPQRLPFRRPRPGNRQPDPADARRAIQVSLGPLRTRTAKWRLRQSFTDKFSLIHLRKVRECLYLMAAPRIGASVGSDGVLIRY